MINFYKKFSSPLKIILSGEHSVVYGKNAIAAAINLRYYCEIHEIEKDTSNFNFFFNNEIIESFGIKNFIKHCDKIYSEGQKSVLEYNVFHEKTSKNLDYLSICKDKDLFYVLFYLFIEKFETKSREKLYDYFQNHSFDLRITTKVPDLTGVGSSASYLSTISACLIVIIFLNKSL